MANRISREELIAEIHRLNREYGKATTTLLREHGKYSSRTYALRFGSWSNALKEAGVNVNRERNISDEDLIEEMQRLSEKLGRTPKMSDMDDIGKYSRGPYATRFGSWNKAVKKANLTPNRHTDISKPDLIDEIRGVSNKLGRTPKRDEMGIYGKYGDAQYARTFGSWHEALDVAGLEQAEQSPWYTDQELVEELHRVSEENGEKIPTWTDMKSYGEVSAKTYVNRFGSWREALKKAEFNLLPEFNEISAKELCEELKEVSSLVGRTPQSGDIGEYSRFPLTWYTRTFGTWNNALLEAGFQPNRWTNVTDEELLAEITTLAVNIERTPRQQDMFEHGRFDVGAYNRRFGSWNKALEQCGLDPVHRYNISETELIEALVDLEDQLGRTPKAKEMDEYGKFSNVPYFDRFGSWVKALESAGLKTPLRFEDVTREGLIDEINRVARIVDGVPKIFDIREYGHVTSGWYYREFGSWNAALREAGFETHRDDDVSNEQLLDEVRRTAELIGKTPTIDEMYDTGEHKPSMYVHRFGSWNEALRAAELEPVKRSSISDDELEEEFYRLKAALGHVPSGPEMEELGSFSAGVYGLRYGSWNDAVRVLGEEPRYASPGDGESQGYGPLWESRREEIIQRDMEACVVCGFERDIHMEEFGKDVNVHHIERFLLEYERTGSYEVAHRSDNLVTVCLQCHRQIEGMSKEFFKQFVPDGVLDDAGEDPHFVNHTLDEYR